MSYCWYKLLWILWQEAERSSWDLYLNVELGNKLFTNTFSTFGYMRKLKIFNGFHEKWERERELSRETYKNVWMVSKFMFIYENLLSTYCTWHKIYQWMNRTRSLSSWNIPMVWNVTMMWILTWFQWQGISFLTLLLSHEVLSQRNVDFKEVSSVKDYGLFSQEGSTFVNTLSFVHWWSGSILLGLESQVSQPIKSRLSQWQVLSN